MPLLAVAYPAFAVLLIALTVWGVVQACRRSPPRPLVVGITLGIWLVALLFMTLRPAGSTVRINLIPDLGGADFSAFDTIANMAVFVPFGLILAASGRAAVQTIVIGVVISVGVETAQFIIDAGRAADINDVITNVAGTALGWAIAWALRAGRRGTARPRERS